jgi:hypothetical protein
MQISVSILAAIGKEPGPAKRAVVLGTIASKQASKQMIGAQGHQAFFAIIESG